MAGGGGTKPWKKQEADGDALRSGWRSSEDAPGPEPRPSGRAGMTRCFCYAGPASEASAFASSRNPFHLLCD